MKEVIRLSTFETNSSSTHSFAFRKKSDEDYGKYSKRIPCIKDNFDKLIVVIGALSQSITNARHALYDWVECNSYKNTDVNNFVENLLALNDKTKMAEFLRNSKEIKRNAYNDYKYFVYDGHDIYDSFVECYPMSTYLQYIHSVDIAIRAYANILGLSEESVKDKIKEIKVCDDDYICRSLFEEGPLCECYCGIEDILKNVKTEYDIESLMRDLLSDKTTIFCYESFGSSTIDDILDNPDMK